MESLRIALFTYSTKPRGGVVHTLRLAEELARLNHTVHVYALSSEKGFFRPVSIPHTLIPCSSNGYENMDEKVREYIRVFTEHMISVKHDYDIYHSEDCISANALFELRSIGSIKFFIRTVHHVDNFTSKSLIDCQMKSIMEPDHIVVVSRFWEKELRSRYFLSPNLIHNGVDIERFWIPEGDRLLKERAKKRFSVDGCKVILSIGGIEPRKNTLTILRAFSIANSSFKAKGERLVWLIGGGETLFDYRAYREEFFSELKRLGFKLDEDIIILNTVPEDLMVELYRAGDVFVFPSVKEGWGLVVLEAMASGLPVIASNIEPLTEYLKDGENAILIPPMDHKYLAQQIVRVLETPELNINGIETAKAFSWQSTALNHLEFYSRVLAERS